MERSLLNTATMRQPMYLLFAATLAACATNSSEDSAVHNGAMVGGAAAKSESLDAIGSLGIFQKDSGGYGQEYFHVTCSATLVAPRVVLTTKACIPMPMALNPDLYFAIGENSKTTQRRIKVKSIVRESVAVDVKDALTIATLEEAIDDIEPLPILDDHVDPSAAGRRAGIVGYGISDKSDLGGDQDRSSTHIGVRRVGTSTIRATTGKLLQEVFPSLEELTAFVEKENGESVDDSQDSYRHRLRQEWDRTAIEGYELWAGGAPGDASMCRGDLGSPLVAPLKDGRLGVLGIMRGGTPSANYNNPCDSVLGHFYSTFPKDIQRQIDEATADAQPARFTLADLADVGQEPPSLPSVSEGDSRCGDETAAGRCDGTTVVRCASEVLRSPRPTYTDCALVNQTCAVDNTTKLSSCVDLQRPSTESR